MISNAVRSEAARESCHDTEIRAPELGRAEHFRRRARGGDPALLEQVGALREVQRHDDILLDQQARPFRQRGRRGSRRTSPAPSPATGPSDGSSSSSRRGCAISARPIATICCCPPDSVPAGTSSLSRTAGNSVQTYVERSGGARGAPRARSCRFRDSRARSSATNSRRPSGTSAIPAPQKRCGASGRRSQPSIDNASAVAGCSPASALISVVLPAPLGPTTQTSSPAPIVSDTPHSAGAAP